MNILSVNNFKFTPIRNNENNSQVVSFPKFGLTMAKPLSKDTVSFGQTAVAQTKKVCGDLKGACSAASARKIIQRHQDAHQKNVELFLNKFGAIVSTKDGESLITLKERLKGIFSLQLKTASLGLGNLPNNEILKIISDVSGICFVLETPDSYNSFVKIFSDMIKHGEINPIEAEYHRLPPSYKRNKLDKSYDTLNPAISQRLKNTIYKYKNPTYQLWKEVDSRSGYSGLHITIANSDGTKTEIQIMTRPMAELKHYENLYYKFRNGKPLDPKYQMLEPMLMPLKPKDPENLTDDEKFIQKALTKYTQEAYIYQFECPYGVERPFLKVSEAKNLSAKEKELLEPFDFNKIKLLVDAYDNYAKA